MRRRPLANAEPDESAALLTAALVLTLFGVLTGIEATGWVLTSTLFTLATVAAVGGLAHRYAWKKRLESVEGER